MVSGHGGLTRALRRAESDLSGGASATEIAMPDIDPLAFGIRFALTHETIGREARKFIRSLTEPQLERPCNQVAKHLRLSGWQQRPPTPLATGDQFPGIGRETEIRITAPSKGGGT
jgi:hypothetical protein